MKRKVIKQGHNTLTVTLPRKWCDKFNIKGGDEVDIDDSGTNLVMSAGLIEKKSNRLEINVTGFDRSAILFTIRSAYRQGYDELFIKFDEQLTHRFKDEKKYKTISFIHYEVERLIGYEVVDQKTNSCMIKDVSQSSEKEFNSMLNRVFLVTIDTFNDFLKGIKEKDFDLISTIEEKHDVITKFVSYCMRLLSKNIPKYPHSKNLEMYHTLASLDSIADVMKYTSRDVMEQKIVLTKKPISLLEEVSRIISLYYSLFFKYDYQKVIDFNKERYVLLKDTGKYTKEISSLESLVVCKLENIVEIINDLCKSTISLNL